MAINLLPPKFKKEKELARTTKTISAFLFAILLIVLILTGGILAALVSTKSDLNKTVEKIADLNTTLAKYKEIDDNIQNVNSKINKINGSNSKKIIWSNLITELAKCTPEKVEIKTLTLNQTNNKIDMTGYAETRSDIAKFKEKMSSSKYFKNVTFTTSTRDETKQNYSFSLSSELGDIK